MKKYSDQVVFEKELRKRLLENRRLYQDSLFTTFDSPEARYVASILGVNPWKVVLPVSLVMALILRLVFGSQFSEIVLDLLGGK